MSETKRGRQPGFHMSNEHRVKIQNSNILNALIEHTLGERKMEPSQVTSGLGLMKKVLPDLQGVTIGGDPEGEPIKISTIENVIVDPANSSS